MNSPLQDDVPMTLAAALQQARADLAAQTLPPALQARVLAAAAAARTATPRRVPLLAWRPRWTGPAWVGSGALACLCVLTASVLLMLRLPPPPVAEEGALRESGFVPVAPPERWPRGAAPAWLVSTELSGARLAALGLPFDPARAGERVPAELLMEPSGEVLAVRFVR